MNLFEVRIENFSADSVNGCGGWPIKATEEP